MYKASARLCRSKDHSMRRIRSRDARWQSGANYLGSHTSWMSAVAAAEERSSVLGVPTPRANRGPRGWISGLHQVWCSSTASNNLYVVSGLCGTNGLPAVCAVQAGFQLSCGTNWLRRSVSSEAPLILVRQLAYCTSSVTVHARSSPGLL